MVRGRILPSAAIFVVLCGVVLADSGAFLGVIPMNLDKEVSEKLGYDGRGVYVPDVVNGGPAEQAGMEDEDIIIEMDGDKIIGTGHLKDFLAYRAPGEKISVKVWRNRKTKTLSVELGERKSELKDVERTIVIRGEPKAWLGIRMQSLTPQLGEHFDVKKGVLISEVIEESPAQAAGLEAGDVITGIADAAVEETYNVSTILSEFDPGDKVEVRIVRDGKSLKRDVELGETPEKHRTKVPYIFSWNGEPMQVPGIDHIMVPKLSEIPMPKLDVPELRAEFEEQLKSLRQQNDELNALRAELKDEMEKLRAEMENLKNRLKESE